MGWPVMGPGWCGWPFSWASRGAAPAGSPGSRRAASAGRPGSREPLLVGRPGSRGPPRGGRRRAIGSCSSHKVETAQEPAEITGTCVAAARSSQTRTSRASSDTEVNELAASAWVSPPVVSATTVIPVTNWPTAWRTASGAEAASELVTGAVPGSPGQPLGLVDPAQPQREPHGDAEQGADRAAVEVPLAAGDGGDDHAALLGRGVEHERREDPADRRDQRPAHRGHPPGPEHAGRDQDQAQQDRGGRERADRPGAVGERADQALEHAKDEQQPVGPAGDESRPVRGRLIRSGTRSHDGQGYPARTGRERGGTGPGSASGARPANRSVSRSAGAAGAPNGAGDSSA